MTTHFHSLPITGTAFDCGKFRIYKHPGDAYCKDNTYPITVEFTLNDPGIYNNPALVYGVCGVDYTVAGTGVTYVNGLGKAVIPAGQGYVDVYIKALNDWDSDEELVFLDVTRAYSTQSILVDKFFKVGNTGGEAVVIMDAGWAVSSAEWSKNAVGNDLIGMWSGLSIYADKNNPNISNSDYLKVDVIVTIEGILPVNGGTVFLQCLDPPNASGTGAANNDGLLKNLPASIKFMPGGPVTQTVTASVGQKAGDNYIIEAIGGSTPNIVHSEILTVWRRLWMELDQMEMPVENNPAHGFSSSSKGNGQGQWNYTAPDPEPDDFDVLFQPPKPDISVLTSAMVDACITVIEATPTIITSWGLTSRETTPFVRNTAGITGPTDVGNLSRDVTVNNASFWCIQGVGAYEDLAIYDWDWNPPALKGEAVLGRVRPGYSVFLVFQETIRDFAKSGWRMKYIGPEPMSQSDWLNPANHLEEKCQRNANELNQIVTFHEVLHLFGFRDATDPSYDPNVDGEIMKHDWMFTTTIPSAVLNLSPEQIKRIQSYDYPH